MDKLDFAILNTLGEMQATSKLQALSRKQLLEEMDIGAQNLFLRLQGLCKKELVDKGFKEGREHTFYLTKDGKGLLEEELG